MDTKLDPPEREVARVALLKKIQLSTQRFEHWCAGMKAVQPKPPEISKKIKGTVEAEQMELVHKVLLARYEAALDVGDVAVMMQHRICAALGGTQQGTERETSLKAARVLEKYSSNQDGSLEHATRLLVVPNATGLLVTAKEWYEYMGPAVDGVHRGRERLVPQALYGKWLRIMGIRYPVPES